MATALVIAAALVFAALAGYTAASTPAAAQCDVYLLWCVWQRDQARL